MGEGVLEGVGEGAVEVEEVSGGEEVEVVVEVSDIGQQGIGLRRSQNDVQSRRYI